MAVVCSSWDLTRSPARIFQQYYHGRALLSASPSQLGRCHYFTSGCRQSKHALVKHSLIIAVAKQCNAAALTAFAPSVSRTERIHHVDIPWLCSKNRKVRSRPLQV